jgi:glycosyltransferase involved in cell wall biosynthesis
MRMKKNQLISIIIPVFNGQSYLTDAINSIIKQKYRPIEIIVVDDGSTDGSAELIRSFNTTIKYHYQTNSGTAAARNFGIHSAKGSFFAFLDQDDLWVENKLILQVSAFENDAGLDAVFGQVKQFHSPEADELFKQNTFCPPSLMPGYLPSAILIKREAFFKVGFFESSWQIGEWADWFIRASERKINMKMLPELVALRRIHTSNKGVLQRKSKIEYVHILKASLDRQRSQNIKNLEQT